MTELETRLLQIVQRLENAHQERDRQFAARLADLTKRLGDGAGRIEILSAQVNALAARIERLQKILNAK